MFKVDLENLLRKTYAVKFDRPPEQPSQRTAECPHPSAYIRYARTGWPEELATHAATCTYCQKSKAAAWSIECPGWGELQNYLQDSNYPDRVALERHLQWTGCAACAARLELLKQPASCSAQTGDWRTVIDNTRTGTTIGTSDARSPIHITVEEDDGSVVVQLTTRNAALAGKALDFRLDGERFETKCTLTFEQAGEDEWRAATTISLSAERLRDLSGKRLISIRLPAADAVEEARSTERNEIDSPERQHLGHPDGKRNASQLPPKSTSELKGLVSAAFAAVVRGVKAERWTAPALGVAGGLPSVSKVRKVVFKVGALKELGLRPYVRVDVRVKENRWKALFLLESEPDPNAPGRDVTPKAGTVEVSLVRPGSRSTINVRLGSHRRGDFSTWSEKVIEEFQSGEEQSWAADVSIRAGAQWVG